MSRSAADAGSASPNQREEHSQHPAVGSATPATPAHPRRQQGPSSKTAQSFGKFLSNVSLSPPACYSPGGEAEIPSQIPAPSLFASRALRVPAARAQGVGGDNKQSFPIDRLKPRFLPETTEVLNTKQGHGGAAQPHGAQTSLRCLHGARLLRLERKGKTPGEVWRKEEGEWRGRRDGGSTHFSLRALTHQDPGG